MLKDAEGDETQSAVRAQAARALGQLKVAAAVETILPLLYDARPETCAIAAQALGMIGEPSAAGPLDDALDHGASPAVRAAAAEALGLLRLPHGSPEAARAIASLINALHDDDALVRIKAALALNALTGQYFGTDAERWENWQKSQGVGK